MTAKLFDLEQSVEGYFFRNNSGDTQPVKIAITGGPSSGKTTVLKYLEQSGVLGDDIVFVPEAATILLSGGFNEGVPAEQLQADEWKRSFQFGISTMQIALEHASESRGASVMICDRGFADGAAYLPGGMSEFSDMVNMPEDQILGRYGLVLHLVTSAKQSGGYQKHTNIHRMEEAEEASNLDDRIQEVWANHPNRIVLNVEDTTERNQQITKIISDYIANT